MGEKEILQSIKQAVVMLMMQSQEGGSSGDEDDEEEEDDEEQEDEGNALDGRPHSIYHVPRAYVPCAEDVVHRDQKY